MKQGLEEDLELSKMEERSQNHSITANPFPKSREPKKANHEEIVLEHKEETKDYSNIVEFE